MLWGIGFRETVLFLFVHFFLFVHRVPYVCHAALFGFFPLWLLLIIVAQLLTGGAALCPTLAAPANGNVTLPSQLSLDHSATFACNNGYGPSGVHALICVVTGVRLC